MANNIKAIQQARLNRQRELMQNSLARHIDLRGINEYIDVVGNEQGRQRMRKFLNC